MKEIIKEKFSGISHKWIKFDFDSEEFSIIISEITKNVNLNKINISQAKNLVNAFKRKEEAWIKYKSTKGRIKNIQCLCEIITECNKKIEIYLSAESILDAKLMYGSPKSLNYFKVSEKNNWKKPSDGFYDDINYPALEEEFTEIGYELYKAYTLEKRERIKND